MWPTLDTLVANGVLQAWDKLQFLILNGDLAAGIFLKVDFGIRLGLLYKIHNF